jgi:hypothetical protein
MHRGLAGWNKVLRHESRQSLSVATSEPLITRHYLRRRQARFHVHEMLSVGKYAPNLHFVQKLAEQFCGRRQR